MQDNVLKSKLYQPVLIHVGKKIVSVGSRGTIKLSEKDIESSPQVQELLARKSFIKLPPTKGKGSDAPAQPSESTDKPKKKDK